MTSLPVSMKAPADRAAQEARDAGELRRLAYIASLHPREREALDPKK
jgi:hypothetical protein